MTLANVCNGGVCCERGGPEGERHCGKLDNFYCDIIIFGQLAKNGDR